ncbi:MAG: carboxypeptidase M32 [Syntrophobacteraceae bacterium]|nr:carboxypeptidase M32 [Syntrophobacteraceae bacterium]
MNPRKVYARLLERGREISQLESIRALLSWDQRTSIPPGGHAHRAAQLATIAELLSIRVADPEMGEMLNRMEESELLRDPLSPMAVNVREWRRMHDRAVKVPRRLSVELARASAEGEMAWQQARGRNDWASFLPYLERIVELKHEEAGFLGFEDEPYDALLNDHEPGQTVRNIEPVFRTLREALVELLDRTASSHRRPCHGILRRNFPLSAQESLARTVVSRLGYDFHSGRLDTTAHPFSVFIGPGDVRITTRYDETCFRMAFFSAIHEAGHALYDQGFPAQYWGQPMGRAPSIGLHESQALLWENLVCRSFGFWVHIYPEVSKHFPELNGFSPEEFYFAVNEVRPSLIRTEADEVTYNLHVLMRFEMELALMRQEIDVMDLPGVWDQKMKAYLGIVPPDLESGVMQDVHWAEGAIGYFPTYTLGNLYAAQFFAAARRDLGDLDELFTKGEFRLLLSWLREKVHSHGSRYRPRELLVAVTGEDLQPEYLVEHLDARYGALYDCRRFPQARRRQVPPVNEPEPDRDCFEALP